MNFRKMFQNMLNSQILLYGKVNKGNVTLIVISNLIHLMDTQWLL